MASGPCVGRAPVPPLPTLAGVTRLQRLLGLRPASSARHLSPFFFPWFLPLAVNPLGQGPRGPCSHCQGVPLGTGEEGSGASPSPAGHQSSCLFRGRPPKYRKIQQEDFQSKCHPLPWCRARLEELGWVGVLGAGVPWLTQGCPSEGLVLSCQN